MEDLDRRLLLGAAGLAGVAAFAGRSKAGPLSPPAGPVAPTAKPLTDVEPRTIVNATNTPGDATAQFIISQSGSYALAANTIPVAGKIAIKITAPDVSLDLRGFTVHAGTDGINAMTAGVRNLSVFNGVISGCGNVGIFAAMSTSGRFADLCMANNVWDNLVTGPQAVIERINITGGHIGILCADGSILTSCTVRSTSATGIQTGLYCALTGCTALFCGGPCIETGGECILRDCNGSGSTANNGIRVGHGTIVTNCIANANTGTGIDALLRNIVSGCTATGNTSHGIHAQFIGRVEGCFCENNGQCGILCENGQITVKDNTCSQNGTAAGVSGAGIRVSGNGNSIEHNTVTANYRGIDMLNGRNAIYSNRAWGNSNADYSMGSGNSYGPVVAALGTGDITGTANSNHPLANLRF